MMLASLFLIYLWGRSSNLRNFCQFSLQNNSKIYHPSLLADPLPPNMITSYVNDPNIYANYYILLFIARTVYIRVSNNNIWQYNYNTKCCISIFKYDSGNRNFFINATRISLSSFWYPFKNYITGLVLASTWVYWLHRIHWFRLSYILCLFSWEVYIYYIVIVLYIIYFLKSFQ